MKKIVLTTCLYALLASAMVSAQEKTAFQIANAWNAAYDVRSDIAIVYGINDAGGNFEKLAGQRIQGAFYDRYSLGAIQGLF